MSTLHIPDDVLKEAGLSEEEALVELACRLFETGRLSLFYSAKLAGVPQPEFEDILLDRRIPLYHYTEQDLQSDLRTLRHLED